LNAVAGPEAAATTRKVAGYAQGAPEEHDMPNKQTEEQAHRAFAHGSSGCNADMAVEGVPVHEDRHIDVPHAREVEPLPAGKKHDHLADKKALAESDQDALLDEALEETFPSSDPISPKHIT
jgi:hypothetical protein